MFDYDGDTNMGNVEDVVASISSCTSSTISPSDSTVVIPKSVEYMTDQRHEICFGMVSSTCRPKLGSSFLIDFPDL